MKKYSIWMLSMLLIGWWMNTSAIAQEQEEEQHIYTVSTFKGVMPEDGSAAERDSLFKMSVELQNSNDKYLSVKVLRHRWGSDFRDWVIMTEYATWADIETASDMDEENFKQKWPDSNYQDYLQAFGKYFPTHSDEIFVELSEYGK